MLLVPDHTTYRHTFLYEKSTLTTAQIDALREYVLAQQVEEAIFQQQNLSFQCGTYLYERTLLIEKEGLHLTSLIVVVLYGKDWSNFIPNILHFHDSFSPQQLRRLANYEFSVMDGQRCFDDFSQAWHP